MPTIVTPEAALFLFTVIAAIAVLLGSELVEARRQRRPVPARARQPRRRAEDALALRRTSLD